MNTTANLADNPVPARSSGRFATAYLREQTWACDSILDLLEHFIHIVPVTDDKGNLIGADHHLCGYRPGETLPLWAAPAQAAALGARSPAAGRPGCGRPRHLPLNPADKARLTFDHVISDRIQDMVDVSFKFYKLLNDDQDFAKFFHEVMFKEYVKMQQGQGATG